MLEDFHYLYDIKAYKINEAETRVLLEEWRSNNVYSEIFTAFISNLCSFQIDKRLTDEELWRWISDYEKPIKNKEDFVIEEAPPKIEQIYAGSQKLPPSRLTVEEQQRFLAERASQGLPVQGVNYSTPQYSRGPVVQGGAQVIHGLPHQGDWRVVGQPVSQGSNLSYFQNVVDPQGVNGGRIEQTVYIQRPESGVNNGFDVYGRQ
ncbi:unnamed protein product [Sphagnum balticum]